MPVPFRKPVQVRQVSPSADTEQLNNDLQLLYDKALSAGASSAVVIETSDVVFSKEVLSAVRDDDGYVSVHWPLDFPKDDIVAAVQAYRYGVFFLVACDPGMPAYGGGRISNAAHRQSYLRVYEIASVLESECFYMGYHLALGFAAGNCRAVFCADEKRCWPMLKGKRCLEPGKARPSMEAAGMDPEAMAVSLQVKGADRDKAPMLAGLVMVI